MAPPIQPKPVPPINQEPAGPAADQGKKTPTPTGEGRRTSGYSPAQPAVEGLISDSQGNLYLIRIFGGATPGYEIHQVPPNAHLLGLPMLGDDVLAALFGDMDPAQVFDLYRQPLWVQIPPGERGQAIFETVARMLNPNGASQQDGLRALLGSPEFQRLFQGGQMTQGATRLIPPSQWVGVL
ncbi:MAG: hypothetical protein ACREP8_16420, partial [Candidatus Binatia bacterium]